MIGPFGARQFTVAEIVTVAVWPAASETKVITGLFPDTPHTPPVSELQETNVSEAGSVSANVTLAAATNPLSVILIV